MEEYRGLDARGLDGLGHGNILRYSSPSILSSLIYITFFFRALDSLGSGKTQLFSELKNFYTLELNFRQYLEES